MECCLLGGEEMTGEALLSAGAAWIPLPTHEGRKKEDEQMFETLEEANVRARCFVHWI